MARKPHEPVVDRDPSAVAGRIPAITEAQIREIESHLELLVPRRFACEAAGVSFRTFTRYMQRGREEEDAATEAAEAAGIDPDTLVPPEGSYWRLLRRITRAEARGPSNAHGAIAAAASKGRTNGLISILERRHPVEYAKPAERVEVTGAGGSPLIPRFDLLALSPAQLRALVGEPEPAPLDTPNREPEAGRK